MATQLGESSQAIREDETRDRDDSPEAGHVREKGLARARDFVSEFRKEEPCLRMGGIPRASDPRAT